MLLVSGGLLQKNLPGTTNSINLTNTDLIGLTPSSSATFIITFYKVGYQSFGGQYYKFKTGYQIFKSMVVQ